VSPGGLSCAP